MKPYRAIPIDKKEFVYGWHIELEDEHYIIPDTASICYGITIGTSHYDFIEGFIKVIPETVGQQISQQDKNKKEIYARDKYKWYQPLVESGKQLHKEHISTVVDEIVELYNLHNRAENCWGGVEIIGNVHQNPEIMDNKK